MSKRGASAAPAEGSSTASAATTMASRVIRPPVRRSRPRGLRGRGLEPGLLVAEAARGVDRGAEVQALVLGLLDQHHGLDGVHVVDPLLLALGRDLRLV